MVNRAGVVASAVRVDSAVVVAVDCLIDCAAADIRIEIAVRVVGCAGRCVLVDVGHRPRIDIVIGVRAGGRILIDVRHTPRIDVLVHVCVGVRAGIDVVIGVRRCAGRSVVVIVRVRAGGRICVVRCAVSRGVVDIFRRRCGSGLCQNHRR